MTDASQGLREWVQSNMTASTAAHLDKWKEKAALIVSVTPEGEVVPRVSDAKLDVKTQVLMHLIGRAYAKAGGFVETASLSNPQLERVIPMPPGTIRWALSELQAERFLSKDGRGKHSLSPVMIGEAIARVETKVSREEQ